jgi:hypothetical protein
MKKNEVKIGTTYRVKVTGKIAEVRITGENPRGGWDGVNVVTNRKVRIKSAQRLRSTISRPAKRKKIVSLAEYNADTKAEHKAKASKKATTPKKADTGEPRGKGAKLGCLDAAVKVLSETSLPQNCNRIVELAMLKGYWQTKGLTPGNTLYAAILREIKNKGAASRFRKADRGKFELAK